MLLRRNFGSSESPATKVCLSMENGLADKINLSERRLFFTTAHAHLKAGCPMLALEVLSKMPKVVKKSKPLLRTSSLADTSKVSTPVSPLHEEKKDSACDFDWSISMVNGLSDFSSTKQTHSVSSLDWSQPSIIIDEPLELKWDSETDEESEASGLSIKHVKPSQSTESNEQLMTGESYSDSCSIDENDFLSPTEDVIAAQLKFRACLKILTGELRTLSTGYEVDGGKLRYQLYSWLERAVVALQKICKYCVNVDDLSSVGAVEYSYDDSLDDSLDQATSKQRKELLLERRQWLLKFQSLLRMFLSFCVLHGSHGGGLASVRMELILLLQESQQVFFLLIYACSTSSFFISI